MLRPSQQAYHEDVSIHALARRATCWVVLNGPRRTAVSIHAPAQVTTPEALLPWLFRSTPPHGGRLSILSALLIAANVSIHAPAQGATRSAGRLGRLVRVSIHAPAQGATVIVADTPTSPNMFQSTPRARGDNADMGIPHPFKGFQSTPPHEGRPDNKYLGAEYIAFRSTPPHKGRRPVDCQSDH
jgi:hypothetical protein